MNIISCPSCSRVENEAFIELAQDVKAMTAYAQQHAITIAVMGCRVNGPGETDHADLGLWCGPDSVHLKRAGESLGRAVVSLADCRHRDLQRPPFPPASRCDPRQS